MDEKMLKKIENECNDILDLMSVTYCGSQEYAELVKRFDELSKYLEKGSTQKEERTKDFINFGGKLIECGTRSATLIMIAKAIMTFEAEGAAVVSSVGRAFINRIFKV